MLVCVDWKDCGEAARTQPCFAAWESSLVLGIGRSVAGSSGDEVGGRRKGRDPVGEAWLVEGTSRCGNRAILNAVCHFSLLAFSNSLYHTNSEA